MLNNYRQSASPHIVLSGAPETAEQVAWLREQQVGGIVSLHPVSDEVRSALEQAGIRQLELHVTDFSDPLPREIQDLRQFVDEIPGQRVLIH